MSLYFGPNARTKSNIKIRTNASYVTFLYGLLLSTHFYDYGIVLFGEAKHNQRKKWVSLGCEAILFGKKFNTIKIEIQHFQMEPNECDR